MSKEKETVKIEIPNSKISAYFPVFGGCLAMLLLAIFISLDVKDLFIVLAAMTTVGIIVTLLIKMVEPSDSPNASWGSPDIYSINPKTNILKYRQHSHGDGRNVNLSKVYKLIFTNHKYIKKLELFYYHENGEKWVSPSSAPFLEKCNDDWQQLFEEIKKRVPEDTEVVVK